MNVGDEITTFLPDGELAHARVVAVRPLIGTSPFPGFAWQLARLLDPRSHARTSTAHYRFDREGIDWIAGWHELGSMDLDAFLAARKLTHSVGDGR